jgi:monoamine oxidase
MPALGSPLVREMRRLAGAYRVFPGPGSAPPTEVLAWYDAHRPADDRVAAAAPTDRIDPRAIERREFLRRSAVLGAGALAAGAAFRPATAAARADRDGPKVVVVGAGLAGLASTYWLRRRGVPAVLHETQGHVGGRCRSIRGFFDANQTAEEGGQFIDSRHRQLRSLARELGLRMVDTFEQSFPEGSQSFRWLDGALRSEEEVFADFGIFIRRLERDFRRVGDYHWNQAGPKARAFDRTTMIEWFDEHLPGGSDSLLGLALGVFMQSFFGIDPSEMSAINLFEAFVVPYPGANERYRLAGGNDRLARALRRAIPDHAIRRESALFAAWSRGDGRIGLRFTDDAYRDVVADRVVLALPFTTLRDVDIAGLRLSARRRRAIAELAMGTNAKLNMQFDRAFAAFDWSAGFSSDEPHYVTWDSTYGQSDPAPRTPVLTIYNGGKEGASYPTDVAHGPAPQPVIHDAFANLERAVTGLSNAFNGKAFLSSWADDPWVHGSYAGFGPGQYTDFWGFLERRERNVFFAGEHTSTHSQGYLNGGVESGERAARQVLRSVSR